jgi:phosphoribosylformylglycinamidine cyclo-ligase
LVGGIAAACADAGCALVGGETAEHPGVMDAQAFDLAGCCVGIVERGRLLDGSGAEAGDAIVGIASSGLHANGYSLVRTLIESWELDLSTPYQEQLMRSLGREADETIHAEPRHVLATLGEVLLEPTLLYAPAILALRETLDAAGSELRGVAHITGGGLPGNLPRMLPASLGARVDPASWPVPSVIRLFAALGGLDGLEARATFNGGVGMAVAVPPAAVDVTTQALAERGHEAWRIGEVVPVDELGGARYAETGSGAEP